MLKNLYKIFANFEQIKNLAFLLGFLGLIPFIISFLSYLLNLENKFIFLNIPNLYGSIILSFLGSVYWGALLKSNLNDFNKNKLNILIFIWSIIPSLMGFLVLLLERQLGLIILSICFIICHIIDEKLSGYNFFPQWYIKLRRILSLSVVTLIISCYLIIE